MKPRTHHCNELRKEDAGSTVHLAGWVNAYRDHGTGLIFIDLRDREGLTQLVFDVEDSSPAILEVADRLRYEDIIAVTGVVRLREGGANPKLDTGEIEVLVTDIELLGKPEKLPFVPSDEDNLPGEELRLRYRFLDLRRPTMQRILRTRHRVTKLARDYFDSEGFLEIETPILCKSTPEGARDFIVPSRLQPGQWYALPQSPQLFKQILMVAGCEKYLQICRCFRDEDPRADRQAEFTQIDCEMSFVDRAQVMQVMEGFARMLWKEVLGVETGEFPVMTYQQAMDRFGSDRPDTRYGLEITDISDLAKQTDFGVFHKALDKHHGVVRCIRVPGGAKKLSRKITDGYSEFVKLFGAGGVPVTKYTDKGFETGVARFLEPIADALAQRLGLEPGDSVLFGADTYSVCCQSLGELRQKVARDLDMIPEGKWNFLWVVDFPMFEWKEDDSPQGGRFFSLHHPFTAPNPDQLDVFMAADPTNREQVESIVSAGYDMVLNGSEIGGGSIRIHQQEVQKKVFALLGISEDEAQEKFSFLLDALRFGAPPHGGVAFGLDRIVMHLVGTDNIRDVIPFPKTQTGADLMTGAPGEVSDEQLEELHVASTWEEPAQT